MKTKEFEKKLNCDYIELLSDFVALTKKIKVKCNLCNTTREVTASSLLKSKNKCKCLGDSRAKTTEKFKKEVFEKVGTDYIVLGEYKNTMTKILMKHDLCKKEFEVTPNKFLTLDTRCPHCNGGVKWGKEKWKEFCEDKNFEFIGLEEDKIKVKHLDCMNEVTVNQKNFRKSFSCPICKVHKHNTNTIKEKILKEKSDTYILLNEYKVGENLLLKHKDCGKDFEISYANFFGNNRECIHCSSEKSKSKEETSLLEFIKENYDGEILENDRLVLDGKELDIYLPELNLAFEYDGIYWHSSEFKSNNYHLTKTIKCEQKGIQLIHIFSTEWNNKRNISESRILNLLGKSKTRIYARKCKVLKLTNKQRKSFFEKNHIQGDVNAKIQYGLEYNKEIVACMSFSKLRNTLSSKKEDATHELLRYSTELNTSVIGGFSKLIKNVCKKEKEIKKIKTFADRRWSIGNVYETNNFKWSHNSNPNYFYFKDRNKLESRNKYQKHKLENILSKYDSKKTEVKNMEDNGYSRIFDSGNKIYYLTV